MLPVLSLPDQRDHTVPPPPAQLPRAARHGHHLPLHGVSLHLENVMKTPRHAELVEGITETFVRFYLSCN